jgi:predicted acetyltransferase
MRPLPTLLLLRIPLPLPPNRRAMPLLPPRTLRSTPPPTPLPTRALPLLTLPLKAPMPLRTLPTPLPRPRRKPLRRRSKRLLYGLNGRADGAENPRLPPAVLFPGHGMPITIREARTARADRDWIEDTYGEYLADLTADTTGVFPSLTVTGQSVTEIIQGWFHDDRCTAFIVLREQEPVGFAVVQRGVSGAADPKRHYRLSEFFIRKPFRNRGVGRGAAMLIFARYAGEWTVPEQSRNPRAIKFWRRVVSEFTNGKFREKRGQGEVAHSFTSAGPVGMAGR